MYKNQRNLLYVFAVVAISFVFAGCSTTPKIGYEAKSTQQAMKKASIYFESFKDDRTSGEKGILGGVYNGYNMRMGNVEEPAGMMDSLKKTFQSELSSSGYSLVEDMRDLSIKADLISITCDLKMKAESTINLKVTLIDKGNQIFSKTYKGQGSTFQMVGFDSTGAINNAIKQIAGQLIQDLNEYITT
jgi:hypothetical protein